MTTAASSGWAAIVPRGCGERVPDGIYAECGLSDRGSPLEAFLIDPPQPLPEGLDIINKAQLWQHPTSSIWHLVIWVGAVHYPHMADYIEEVRRFGVSRRIGAHVDISLLTPGQSMMIFAHPRARLTSWEDRSRALNCRKNRAGHAENDTEHPPAGPCLFKTYDLIAPEDGTPLIDIPGERALFERTIGSTTYTYSPTGESDSGLKPGLFAMLPLHGFALVRGEGGRVDETKAKKLSDSKMPWYLADK